jgi:hypothetical protein
VRWLDPLSKFLRARAIVLAGPPSEVTLHGWQAVGGGNQQETHYQSLATAVLKSHPNTNATLTLVSVPTRKYSAKFRSSNSLTRINPFAAMINPMAS